MSGFDSPEIFLGLLLLGVGQFVEHPKLEGHHLHLLVVIGMVCLEVVHQCNSQLLLLHTTTQPTHNRITVDSVSRVNIEEDSLYKSRRKRCEPKELKQKICF